MVRGGQSQIKQSSTNTNTSAPRPVLTLARNDASAQHTGRCGPGAKTGRGRSAHPRSVQASHTRNADAAGCGDIAPFAHPAPDFHVRFKSPPSLIQSCARVACLCSICHVRCPHTVDCTVLNTASGNSKGAPALTPYPRGMRALSGRYATDCHTR